MVNLVFMAAIVAGLLGLGWAFIAIMIGTGVSADQATAGFLVMPAVILIGALAMFALALYL